MILKIINPKYYLSKINDIRHFLINPVGHPNEHRTVPNKIIDFIVILLISLTFYFAASYLIIYLFHPLPSLKYFELNQKLGPTYFFLLSVFLIPLLEESAFRLSFIFSTTFLSISFAVLFHRILSRNVFETSPFDMNTYPCSRLIFALVATLLFYLFISTEKRKNNLSVFWSKHFKWVFYLSCLIFASIHISNYKSSLNIVLSPLLTLPQFIFGLFAGYVRINYGFIYAVLLHTLTNASLYLF